VALKRLGGARVAILCLLGRRLFLRRLPNNLEEHSRLALYTAALVVGMPFVVLVAGLALCYGESNNLT
jgi:hypothetical protein